MSAYFGEIVGWTAHQDIMARHIPNHTILQAPGKVCVLGMNDMQALHGRRGYLLDRSVIIAMVAYLILHTEGEVVIG